MQTLLLSLTFVVIAQISNCFWTIIPKIVSNLNYCGYQNNCRY